MDKGITVHLSRNSFALRENIITYMEIYYFLLVIVSLSSSNEITIGSLLDQESLNPKSFYLHINHILLFVSIFFKFFFPYTTKDKKQNQTNKKTREDALGLLRVFVLIHLFLFKEIYSLTAFFVASFLMAFAQ